MGDLKTFFKVAWDQRVEWRACRDICRGTPLTFQGRVARGSEQQGPDEKAGHGDQQTDIDQAGPARHNDLVRGYDDLAGGHDGLPRGHGEWIVHDGGLGQRAGRNCEADHT